MSKLVVVSNRVGNIDKAEAAGGLAVAVGATLKDTAGLWFGWDGTVAANVGEASVTKTETFGGVSTTTIPLSRREYRNYYLGYSNRVIWPIFHYRLDLETHRPAFFEAYRQANARIAEVLSQFISDDDLVWVHDYHLMPLAAELRRRNFQNRIGFFLHIPFPPPDIFLAIPDHAWLAEALFSFDVVGFQTKSDLENFRRYILVHAKGSIEQEDRLTAYGHSLTARAFPIGIDVGSFHHMAHSPEAHKQIRRLRQRTFNHKQIIGVDRLDYTKGLPDRLHAFRRLLELYPEHIKTTSLNQIAPPTREEVPAYIAIRKELEGLSGEINGEFGDFDWTPVRYIHRTVPRDTLAALYRGSAVGLVVPLRDGMNLVAKEYVAAQSTADPGVLILSCFAGASEDLEEAIIVNPYDRDGVANAMRLALGMPLGERRERYRALFRRICKRDANHWRNSFLATLKNVSSRRKS